MQQTAPRGTITPFEFSALAYLALPVAAFFLAYARLRIGIPLAGCIGYALWQSLRLIDRGSAFRLGTIDLFYLYCAAVVVYLSGSFGGGFYANSDWIKHFGVLRFLIDNPLLTSTAPGYDGATMRYYLGWYIAPALTAKLLCAQWLLPIVGTWSTIGLYLFFRIAGQLAASAPWRYALPLVFLTFSGADALGSWFTGYALGPTWHLEWWSGWVQYSAMLTDAFWAPQHALSAWIGIALALRLKDSDASLVVFPVATAAILMWSPFSAVGLAPFYLWTMASQLRRLRRADLISALLMLLVSIGLLLYLGAGESGHGMALLTVFGAPCLTPGPCYTAGAYVGFVLIEALGFIIVLQIMERGRSTYLWIAAAMLLLLPIVKYGGANDLNLHASIPPLSLLAVTVWQKLWRAKSWAAFSLGALLAFGLATPAGEVRRAFYMEEGPPDTTTMQRLVEVNPGVKEQYLVDRRPRLLRKP